MSKEQFTPQSNHSSEIDKPTPSPRVLMALEGGELRAKIKDLKSANRQAESEIKRHPLRLAAAFVLGGVATAATFGLLGMIKPMESKPRVASAVITIYDEDPYAIQKQICDTQHDLERKLGLPESLPYDTFKGCEGTTGLATKDGKLGQGDKVKVDVEKDLFFGASAEAKKIDRDQQ